VARISRLTGWKQVVIYGVLSVVALGALAVLTLAVVVGWAANGGGRTRRRGGGCHVPVHTADADGQAGLRRRRDAGARLEIELTDGDFEIQKGAPGSDIQIEGELVGNYYELVEEREGVGRDGAVTAVRLRATTSSMVRMMASLMGDSIDGAPNRLTISIPPDRLVSLVLDVQQGDRGSIWAGSA